MQASRAHTRALIRILRSVPLSHAKARRGRLPRQMQPDHLRVGYYRALLPILEAARAAFLRELPHIAHEHREWVRAQKKDGRLDADPKAAAKASVDRAQKTFLDKFSSSEVFDVARQFGKRTSDFQKEQLDRQVRAAVGVPYTAIEKPARDRVEGWAALNVDLIKTVPERYFDRLRRDVEEAYSTGMSTDELIDRFTDDYGIQENDATRIVVDQIGKLSGQLNQDRQESLGVSRFVWRSVNDSRVRESHADLDGETFDWDEPVPGGGTNGDEEGFPGQGINCRCYAEPILDDILAE